VLSEKSQSLTSPKQQCLSQRPKTFQYGYKDYLGKDKNAHLLLKKFTTAPDEETFKKFKFFFGPYSPKLNVLKFMNYEASDDDEPPPEPEAFCENPTFNDMTTILTGSYSPSKEDVQTYKNLLRTAAFDGGGFSKRDICSWQKMCDFLFQRDNDWPLMVQQLKMYKKVKPQDTKKNKGRKRQRGGTLTNGSRVPANMRNQSTDINNIILAEPNA
jgi:hypothetical protein